MTEEHLIFLQKNFFSCFSPFNGKLTHAVEYVVEKHSQFSGKIYTLGPRWQTQGLKAESGPPPCFIRPITMFLPSSSTQLLAPS